MSTKNTGRAKLMGTWEEVRLDIVHKHGEEHVDFHIEVMRKPGVNEDTLIIAATIISYEPYATEWGISTTASMLATFGIDRYVAREARRSLTAHVPPMIRALGEVMRPGTPAEPVSLRGTGLSCLLSGQTREERAILFAISKWRATQRARKALAEARAAQEARETRIAQKAAQEAVDRVLAMIAQRPAPPEGEAGGNTFCEVAGGWFVQYEGEPLGTFKERGFGFIGQLVRRPKTRLSYEVLEAGLNEQQVQRISAKNDSDDGASAAGRKGVKRNPVMEWGSIQEARDRQREIELELQDTQDPAESAELGEEHARIDTCVSQATKPGGTDGKGALKQLDEEARRLSERVRKPIDRAIKTIATLGQTGPKLATHLHVHVKKADGAAAYLGDITWET